MADRDASSPGPFLLSASQTGSAPAILFPHDESYRLLFLNNPQPMWVYDRETQRILEVNEAAIAHYGYSRADFLSMRASDVFPRPDLAESGEAGDSAAQARRQRHVLKNGRVIEAEIHCQALQFGGRPAELVVAHDITQRARTEEALRQAESKYRHIFEEAIVGIFQSTPAGKFISANAAMAKMLGYDSPQELVDSIVDIQNQLYVDSSRREEFKSLLAEHGILQGFEFEVFRKDRSRMWLSVNVRAVREAGIVLRYEGTFEDVSERKKLEDQFRQSQKMEAVGRLAGGVAHDFNNALGVITGYSDLLQMRLPPGDPLRGYADEIAKAGHRAASLTRQLLAFSRKQVIQPVALDLNSVVADMEKMLHRLIGEDIQITVKRAANLDSIKADPGQVEQVLMNLAVNARDAMPQGGKLFVETANIELDETYRLQHSYVKPGHYVMLSFSDTGCGIDKEAQTHIFEPFFTTKEAGKGTGLGLSTVYGIVKQSGGYILVYSEKQQGTTFKLYWPRVQETAVPTTMGKSTPQISQGTETVLLVEDEEPLRQLARTCLETAGYTVLCVPDGRAAIDVVKQYPEPIQLLLTDVIMPGMSGRDLAKVVAALRPTIKVLFMSGYTNDLIAQYGVLAPETMLLEKPFTLYSLLNKVESVLRKKNSARTAAL